MKKGFIYFLVDWFINKLNYINLVELFKTIAEKLFNREVNKRTASRTAVDIFIILKWIFISFCWYSNIQNQFINYIVWYLIFSNIYTYFFHHVWSKNIGNPHFDIDRIKRRFLNLILSILFNIFSFAYLFAQPFNNNFEWKKGNPTFKDSLFFSLSNSISTNYEYVTSISEIGHTLTIIETIISFAFLTIILSNSIPQTKN